MRAKVWKDCRALLIPDAHYPNQDKSSIKAVRQYAEDQGTWDYLVNLGDLGDMPSLFTKIRSELQDVSFKKVKEEFQAHRDFWNHFRGLANEAYWIGGNHEYRTVRWSAANNQDPEMWDWAKEAANESVTWVDYQGSGETLELGSYVTCIHGVYVNQNHSRTHYDRYNGNVFYGHLHDLQRWAMHTNDRRYPRLAQSCGCLCEHKQAYHIGKPAPTKWEQGFVELRFTNKTGWFNYQVHPLVNHEFTVGGRVYKPTGSVDLSKSNGLMGRK